MSDPSQIVEEALRRLVNRLDEVHADERYKSVWTLYAIHGGKYTEPKYDKELLGAREALAAIEKQRRGE